MSTAPIFQIQQDRFWDDPYPFLKLMRNKSPISFVPQFNATLFTKRNSIAENESKFSHK